jgi:hypothetical protein
MRSQNQRLARTSDGRFGLVHGARSLASRLTKNRLEPRLRRVLNRLQLELATAPIETLLALALARYARQEIIAQQAEAHLLADQNATPSKWLLGLWNSMRRDAELIAVLEPRVSQAQTPSLAEYLAGLEAKQEAASAQPPAQERAPAAVPDPVFSRVPGPAATGTDKFSGTEKPDPVEEEDGNAA